MEALAVLGDGRLASGSLDHTIRLWDGKRGMCEATLEGHTGSVTALAVLADGRLASGSAGNTIRLLSPANGMWEATLEGLTERGSALTCWPTDGSYRGRGTRQSGSGSYATDIGHQQPHPPSRILRAATTRDPSIVEQIEDMLDQIDHYVAGLLSIRDVLRPLEALRHEDLAGPDRD